MSPVRGLYLAGAARAATSNRTFAVDDPATGLRLAEVADATPEDGIAAVDAAARSAKQWAALAPRARAVILGRVYATLQERREEFAALITAEMGKTLAEARAEVDYGSEFFRWFAETAPRLHLDGGSGLEPGGNYRILTSTRPVGICLLITPWNFPLAMAARKIAPALAAGCTVILKPAAQTPLTSLLLAELLTECGVPAGVVNVVPCTDAPAVIAAIMRDPRLRKLSFTGSTQVGRVLLEQAAHGVLRTSMELGGNAPLIVFDDADLEQAIAGSLVAKLRNGGQSCIAANRIYVQRGIAERFIAGFSAAMQSTRPGDGRLDDSDIGPLIDERQRDKVISLVDDAVTKGATVVVAGGAVDGLMFAPTVLTDIPLDAALREEEIFGPVAAIYVFDDEAEVIDAANDTPYGLVSYVFTQNVNRALRVADALDTGMTGINRGVVSNAAAPFGGTKASGLGREGGAEGILEYLETKYVGIEL